MLFHCLFLVILKISFYNPSQVAICNMNYYSHLFIIWIAINCYQVLFGEHFMYYWKYIFHLEETSILYWLLFISLFQINLMSNREKSSKQEVLWKIAFLDNSGKLLENKYPWRNPFLVMVIACSFTKNSTMDVFVGVFRKFSEQLINRQFNSRRLSLKQIHLYFKKLNVCVWKV